jgi:hypothetical protein
MNNVQLEKEILRLKERVAELEAADSGSTDESLAARVALLERLLAPRCHFCDAPSAERRRIVEGGLQQDVWVCESCKKGRGL